MNKKILLIDIDSKMPNLALMKISAHHKALGDDVSFNNTDVPDIVYASIVFSKNKLLANGLKFFYPSSEIVIGGSGYNLNSRLPDEIESLKPDYDLYPEIDYSLGYTTRGCNRSCGFCIVPQKEGRFTHWHNPERFYDERFDKIVFLDNNILLDKSRFIEVCDFCIDRSLKVWFTQGLDIRLLDDKIATKLNELDTLKGYHFAFDDSKLEPIIRSKCEMLKNHGIDIRRLVQFYVYLDSIDQYDDAVNRCRILKELNTNPFVMFNINNKPSKKVNALRRWANRKWVFWSCDFADYTRKFDGVKLHA
ncbi:MAG: hypothetical protein PHP06_05930 [Clostridia bacterium]|nr:hypothetical protein [Clostridia bacterium]